MPLLELKGVTKNFGKLQAVSSLDFRVEKGEIHSLIGPNGAGKTTVFNLITGTFPVTSGAIILDGEDITRLEPHEVAQRGVSRSFQQTFLFMQSTVLDNVLIGLHMRSRSGALHEFLHTPSARKADGSARQEALDIIDFMGLGALKGELAGNLPHGHQRALGVSIALACNPVVLLLDEPVTGMNPTETASVMQLIRSIQQGGRTVTIVEHNMRVIMGICSRIAVISFGTKIAEGNPEEIACNDKVISVYLGKRKVHAAN